MVTERPRDTLILCSFRVLKPQHKNDYFLFTMITRTVMLAVEKLASYIHTLNCAKEESGFIIILFCQDHRSRDMRNFFLPFLLLLLACRGIIFSWGWNKQLFVSHSWLALFFQQMPKTYEHSYESQYHVVVKTRVFRVCKASFEFRLCHIVAVSPWTSYLAALHLPPRTV